MNLSQSYHSLKNLNRSLKIPNRSLKSLSHICLLRSRSWSRRMKMTQSRILNYHTMKIPTRNYRTMKIQTNFLNRNHHTKILS
jgi:hypothetical protein